VLQCQTDLFAVGELVLLQGTKMLFSIQVHKVIFPQGTSIPKDAEGIK
jgi:hypothetical protein